MAGTGNASKRMATQLEKIRKSIRDAVGSLYMMKSDAVRSGNAKLQAAIGQACSNMEDITLGNIAEVEKAVGAAES